MNKPALVTILILTLGACTGPLGPISGGHLAGASTPPPPDWSFVNAVEVIQLETLPASKPHSVNVWAGSVDGKLYIPTSLIRGSSDPIERDWVKNVIANPQVRIRINGKVYSLRAERVEDAATIDIVRTSLQLKYEIDVDDHFKAGWIFRLV